MSIRTESSGGNRRSKARLLRRAHVPLDHLQLGPTPSHSLDVAKVDPYLSPSSSSATLSARCSTVNGFVRTCMPRSGLASFHTVVSA